MRPVYIAGVGIHPFGRFDGKTVTDLGVAAVRMALKDAGSEHGGFQASPERTPGTYSKYNSIDDRIDDLHYLTTGTKFGIARASYDAAQEIRSCDISREEGVALVKL